MRNSLQIGLGYRAIYPVEELERAYWLRMVDQLFILERRHSHILDVLQLQVIIRFPVVITVSIKPVTNLVLQLGGQPPTENLEHRAVVLFVSWNLLVVTHGIILECEAINAHRDGKPHNLALLNDELLLKPRFLLPRLQIDRYQVTLPKGQVHISFLELHQPG